MRIEGDWSRLVVSLEVTAQLMALETQCRNIGSGQTAGGSGAGVRQGVHAFFAGPNGTGKTLAAEILAARLGKPLQRVALTAVVSQHIGETEKNLDRVFAAARQADAVLLLDQADALFGQRTDVHDAHDRYANLEINYLLQRIENYEGLVILASNLAQHVDPAFLRRLRVIIEFPPPGAEGRRRI